MRKTFNLLSTVEVMVELNDKNKESVVCEHCDNSCPVNTASVFGFKYNDSDLVPRWICKSCDEKSETIYEQAMKNRRQYMKKQQGLG